MKNFIVDKKWVEENYHGEADFVIPEGATIIDKDAFRKCEDLTSVHIPDGVTSIGRNAFSDCMNLTSINIPDSVTKIGDGAFRWCKSLTSVNIPDSVSEIGMFAFCECKNLTSINIPDGVTEIGWNAFWECDTLKLICNKGSYAEEYAKSNDLETCKPIALKEQDELLAQVKELTKIIDMQKEEINELKKQQEVLRNHMVKQKKEASPKSLGGFQIEEFHDEDGQLMPEELSESRLSFTEEDGKFYVNFRHCIDSHDIPDIVTKYEVEYSDIVAVFADYKTKEKDIQEIFNTFAKSMYHPEKNATSFQKSAYIKDRQFIKDIDEYINSNSPTLVCIKKYSEYFAGGDLAERGCHTEYIKKDGKYYEMRTEFDDYAETDFDTEKSECKYSDIVKALAAAMQTETEYEDVYSGCYDAIVSNGVTYTIADEQLKKDVAAFLKEEQKTVNNTVKQEGMEM